MSEPSGPEFISDTISRLSSALRDSLLRAERAEALNRDYEDVITRLQGHPGIDPFADGDTRRFNRPARGAADAVVGSASESTGTSAPAEKCPTCEALGLSVVEPESELTVPMTEEELEWVEHGASLRGLTAVEYTRRAINAALRKQGVDAVLLAENDDELGACRHGVAGGDHCPDCEAMKA